MLIKVKVIDSQIYSFHHFVSFFIFEPIFINHITGHYSSVIHRWYSFLFIFIILKMFLNVCCFRHWLGRKLKSILNLRTKSIASRSVWKKKKEFRRNNNVSFSPENKCNNVFFLVFCSYFWFFFHSVYRNDDKTASDYKVQGGSVLHLVLALRGGLNE